MTDNKFLKAVFDKSRSNKGHIYLLKQANIVRIANSAIPQDAWMESSTGKKLDFTKIPKEAIKKCLSYKYGKTKNMEKRMAFYPKGYELLKSYKVNHMSLREELIRQDNEIVDDRDWNNRHHKSEHVEFDCSEIVDLYATGSFKLNTLYNRIEFYDKEGNFVLDVMDYYLMNIIRM
jgi:hypothetical protein